MIVTDIILKKNKTQYDIIIDGDQRITVDMSLVIKFNINKSMEIDEEWLKRLEDEVGFYNAYEYALRLLTIKGRTTGEIKNKLFHRDYSIETINKTLDKLMNMGYINDEKYIEDFIKEKCSLPGMSRKAIFYKLLNKGLDKYIIEKKFNEAEIDDYNTAVMAARKKAKTIVGEDKVIRNKLYSYLKGKGYYDTICIKAINTVLSETEWE